MDRSFFSPRTLGDAIGVSQSSLKRWADRGLLEVERTAGGHRRIDRREALRFIREAGLQVVKPELLGLADDGLVDLDDGGTTSVRDRFCRALQTGDESEARAVVLSLFTGGCGLANIFDQVFQPALAVIGELWLDDPHGIAVEHRATDICTQILGDLRGRLEAPEGAPAAIGASPGGDPYLLPSNMIAVALSSEGYRAVNLGPNFPLTGLAAAAVKESAQFVWLSVTHGGRIDELREEILQLREQLSAAGIPLLIGGAAYHKLGLPQHPSLATGESIGDVISFARQLAG